MATRQIHATCVDVGGRGVLLRGPSGSGKSDLALRLIDTGARLVADDRTDLYVSEDQIVASAPEAIAGRMEVRGLGVVEVAHAPDTLVALIVDLRPGKEIERMPKRQREPVEGVPVPRIEVAPFEPSAPAKIRLALRLISDNMF